MEPVTSGIYICLTKYNPAAAQAEEPSAVKPPSKEAPVAVTKKEIRQQNKVTILSLENLVKNWLTLFLADPINSQ